MNLDRGASNELVGDCFGGGLWPPATAIVGVKTFVAPLWRVADAAQEAFMTLFYKELSAARRRAEALRLAKLQLLHKPETANFLYWAPVILSGDPGPLPAALFQR